MHLLQLFLEKRLDRMSVDPLTKPRVTISLNPVYEAFCRWYFSRYYKANENKRNKEILITRKDHLNLGNLFSGLIANNHVKISIPVMENPVTFILPITDGANAYIYRYNYIYFPKWAEKKIEGTLSYEFHRWAREKFEKGYEKGKTQKQIANAILRGLSLRNNTANMDLLLKSDYRHRTFKEQKDFEDLLTLEELAC